MAAPINHDAENVYFSTDERGYTFPSCIIPTATAVDTMTTKISMVVLLRIMPRVFVFGNSAQVEQFFRIYISVLVGKVAPKIPPEVKPDMSTINGIYSILDRPNA